MFSFNLFGIPMIGADICGFERDSSELLCAKWAQLGSLYPFCRNHNHEFAKDQEFTRMGPTVLETSRQALKLRYSILKYYYSLFFYNVFEFYSFKKITNFFFVERQGDAHKTFILRMAFGTLLLRRRTPGLSVLNRGESLGNTEYEPFKQFYSGLSSK